MRTIRRETFIALRARRQAHQIASEIINPTLDLNQVYCRECGKALRHDRLDRNERMACHRCGHVNILPHELADRVRAAIPYADHQPGALRANSGTAPRRRLSAVQFIACVVLTLMLFALAVLTFSALFEARGNPR